MARYIENNFIAFVAFVVLVSTALLICGCSYINERFGLKDDHFVEESAEAIIREHTNLDIDLTPESPEKR